MGNDAVDCSNQSGGTIFTWSDLDEGPKALLEIRSTAARLWLEPSSNNMAKALGSDVEDGATTPPLTRAQAWPRRLVVTSRKAAKLRTLT